MHAGKARLARVRQAVESADPKPAQGATLRAARIQILESYGRSRRLRPRLESVAFADADRRQPGRAQEAGRSMGELSVHVSIESLANMVPLYDCMRNAIQRLQSVGLLYREQWSADICADSR